MCFPKEYKYTKDHEWVSIDGEVVTIGISAHAAEQLGDVVYVELPEVDDSFEKGDVFGVVESVKAAVDCYMPVSGEVVAINEELESAYETMNEDPHGQGWMVKIKASDLSELDDLMDQAAYIEYLSTLA